MTDPCLAAWNDGPARSAVIDFVARVTERGPGFVPAAERVAVFDNDGTLWCEKPMPIQLDFAIRGLAGRARQDPTLAHTQPWRAALGGDLRWFGDAMVRYYDGDASHARLLIDAISGLYDDLTVEEYATSVGRFFESATHPTLGTPYTSCGFLPMVQLLDHLRAHDFAAYIASGGDRDFMRAVAEKLYGVPPEQVIGSALGLAYFSGDGRSSLLTRARWRFLTTGRRSRSASGAASAGGPSWPSATPTGTSRCWSTRAAPTAPRCGC